MSQLIFTFNGGRTRKVTQAEARLLTRMGKGSVVAADVAPDLDAMDVDALRALAQERGLKVHHNAGADKLRAALREASA
ncbi:MAG: hypothetical protein DI587_38445 [Variovorax paradoxus]|nr:MAG: hypothetical protein DI583_38445 [Variovorax paradoxus]PZP99425.1 MAG: hypothetical protein DI587_38445 [Variovorax paradoxus]